MFVIANIAGVQEKIEKGMKLKVPLLDKKEGETLKTDQILLTSDGEKVRIGAPYIEGASAELKVLRHGKDDKIVVRKIKRRKRYRRTHGHRQQYTEVEVIKIND